MDFDVFEETDDVSTEDPLEGNVSSENENVDADYKEGALRCLNSCGDNNTDSFGAQGLKQQSKRRVHKWHNVRANAKSYLDLCKQWQTTLTGFFLRKPPPGWYIDLNKTDGVVDVRSSVHPQ